MDHLWCEREKDTKYHNSCNTTDTYLVAISRLLLAYYFCSCSVTLLAPQRQFGYLLFYFYFVLCVFAAFFCLLVFSWIEMDLTSEGHCKWWWQTAKQSCLNLKLTCECFPFLWLGRHCYRCAKICLSTPKIWLKKKEIRHFFYVVRRCVTFI